MFFMNIKIAEAGALLPLWVIYCNYFVKYLSASSKAIQR